MNKIKMLEAFAAAILLVTWYMDWNSVQKWQKTQTGLMDEEVNFFQVIHDQEIDYKMEMLLIWSDIFQNSKDTHPRLIRDIAQIWIQPRVRKVWADNLVCQLNVASTFYVVLLQEQASWHIDSNPSLGEIRSTSNGIYSGLATGLDEQGVNYLKNAKVMDGNTPSTVIQIRTSFDSTPDDTKISATQAFNLDLRLKYLVDRFQNVVGSMEVAIKAKSDFYSFIYHCLYVLGSIMLVGSKVYESVSRKDANPKRKHN